MNQEVQEETTEFEDAFAEFTAAKEGSDDRELVDPDPNPAEQASADAEEPAPEITEPKDDEPDPLEGLTDAQKERFEELQESNRQLQHKYDSNVGRVTAFQRQVQELQTEIQSIREGSTSGEQPSQQDIVTAMSGSVEGWDKFAEDYPEIAKVIDQRFEAAGKATQESVNQTLAPVKEQQAATAQKAAEDAKEASEAQVGDVFSNWREDVNTDGFQQWLANQSEGVASLADSPDGSDAISLLELYDAHLGRVGQPLLQRTANETQDPGPDGVETQGQTELDKKRQQQLEAGQAPESRPSGYDPSGGPVDEFEAAFTHFANKREANRANA